MERQPRALSFAKAFRATALLWGLFWFLSVALAVWSGQISTQGDLLTSPITYLTATTPALGLYLVFRATASWPAWRAAATLAAAVPVVGLLQTTGDYGGQALLQQVMRNVTPVSQDAGVIVRIIFIYLVLDAFNAAVIWLLAAQEQARRQERLMAQARVEASEARAAALDAELRALRLQLDPHFVFNALNSVAGLIATGRPQQAEVMVLKLTDFLRGVLGGTAPQVALSEEIAAADDYLEVERVRFPDRIQLAIDCPDELQAALVPDFILQPLVENSVKYGLAAGRQVQIEMIARRQGEHLQLVVEDNGGVATAGEPGFGIGLSTTRQRLNALYGDTASLTAGTTPTGFRVDVRLPLEFRAAPATGGEGPGVGAATDALAGQPA